MSEVGLRLHPEKTRIVYCKDGKRRGEHEHISFTFLGFTFRPRKARNGKDGSYFLSFLPGMSTEALMAKSAELRKMRIHRRTNLNLDDLAGWLNPIVAGWMAYYGRFYRTAMDPLLRRINAYLMRWAGKKVSATATGAPKVLAVVDRVARTTARPLRSLEVGSCLCLTDRRVRRAR